MPFIAEVILPLPVKSNYDYLLKDDQVSKAQTGVRALVAFGKRKIYTGVIHSVREDAGIHNRPQLRHIEEILDDNPVLTPEQLKLFEWISFYYMCTEGEVLKAALPSGLKPESSLKVEMQELTDWEDLPLKDKEYLLMEALSIQPTMSFAEISKLWDVNNPAPRLREMEAKGYIKMYHQVDEKYKPKYKTFLQLNEQYTHDSRLREVFDSFTERQIAQENLLLKVVEAFYKDKVLPKSETLKELEIGPHVVKSLAKKKIIDEVQIQIDRLELYGYQTQHKHVTLTPEQQSAVDSIKESLKLERPKPVLLHGITGSGKTHIYTELIREALKEGKQALYLLPEITLTKQIIDRVKGELGVKVGVYHSKFNDHERVEIWHKVNRREYDIVIGVRSSIFLPFQDLGIIIVDEEHDTSFKQQEPAPRYNARDVAVYYAFMQNIPIVLGSATPSFESYNNSLQGKYHLVTLKKRAIATQMPTIEIVDMRQQRKKRLNQGIFSSVMIEAIQKALMKEEQVILFQNRRGYAPYLICETCGQVPQCINCDISLTYHKHKGHLRCHYCGYTQFETEKCGYCENFTLRRAGIGTEKIEEEIQQIFPNHKIARMDLDTTRGKFSFQQLISQFESRQIDILVGTQMVSKGLDFDNVTLVGVINADNILSFPDFRAYEHAYQLLTQVSGRAGRKEKTGKVLIQSSSPDNLVLTSIEHPYENFYYAEAPQRKPLHYPPFYRLIRIEVRHRDREYIEKESIRLQKLLYPHFGSQLLGPDYALVGRVRNQYRMQFLLKLSKQYALDKLRGQISEIIEQYYRNAPQKTLRIIVDVDPF